MLNILGSGYSLIAYKFKEGDTVWCPASMKNEINEKYVSLFFGMHKNQDADINLKNYPIEEISNKYKSCFFTNTVSYMLAYALYKGYTEINLYGVDMNSKDEYVSQRASVLYWIGYLRAKKVKVNVMNDIDKPCAIYGYESNQALKTKIELMKQNAIINKESSKTEDERNQYIGFIHALNQISLEL